LITIKVTDENPETAAKIANLVGDRFAKLCAKQTKTDWEYTGVYWKSDEKRKREHGKIVGRI